MARGDGGHCNTRIDELISSTSAATDICFITVVEGGLTAEAAIINLFYFTFLGFNSNEASEQAQDLPFLISPHPH